MGRHCSMGFELIVPVREKRRECGDALNKAYYCKRGKGNPKNETDENMKKELNSAWLQDETVRGVLTRGRLCDNNKSLWGLLEQKLCLPRQIMKWSFKHVAMRFNDERLDYIDSARVESSSL